MYRGGVSSGNNTGTPFNFSKGMGSRLYRRFNKRRNIMQKYQCGICGYVYDPAVGDPDGGIAPGTAFEDIPDSWVCPICGATKDSFSPVNE